MKKEYKHKSPESAAREKAHQFGQPGGNKPCPLDTARGMRDFYRWVESATLEQLNEYHDNKDNPYLRRKFIEAITDAKTPQDFFDLTNQTHGAPKQTIETVDAPTIIIDLGDDDEDEKPKRKRGRKPKAK